MKESKAMQIIKKMPNIKIEYDNVQKLVFSNDYVHHLYFEINRHKYIYSETNNSYILSTMKGFREKFLFQTLTLDLMVEYLQGYDFVKQKLL